METDSLSFLTLINKVQRHSVGVLVVLGVFVFKTPDFKVFFPAMLTDFR